jgi:hypothetical protein
MVSAENIVTSGDVVRLSGFSLARVSGILARVTPLKPLAKGQTALYDVKDVREVLANDFAVMLDFLQYVPKVEDEKGRDAVA